MAMDIDSVLNVMRQEHAPSAGDQARVRSAIAAALVVGGAAHVGATAGVKGLSAFKGATWAVPVWIKGTVGMGAAIAAVGGGVYGMREYAATQTRGSNVAALEAQSGAHTSTKAAPQEDPQLEVRPPNDAPGAMPLPETVTLNGDRDGSLTELRTPRAESAKPLSARTTTPKMAAPASVGHTTTSLDELRLLGEASKALREGRTEQARSVLSEHERRYSNTALAPERAGLDLLARCTDSPAAEVRRAALDFLRRSPNSPLAGNIRRKCLE